MKNSTSKRSAGAQFKLKPTMVMAGHATAGAIWAVTAAGPAYAQQAAAPAAAASAPETQQVVVTGIRKGIEDAISVKKNQDSIVEAISAEDIGKLPDTTIAESLARLPGLTTQRDKNGNATSISIRGLSPDFTGFLLNGREQVSTGDSRAADLSVYPAELIAGATVYKTGDASLLVAGLSGTIDNKLIQPLNFPKRVIAGAVENDETGRGIPGLPAGHGKRYSLSYIDQFADRKIGLALGWVHASGTSNQVGVGGWGTASVTATTTDNQTITGVSVPNFGNGVDFKNERVFDNRTGLAGIIEFRPSKDFSSEIDVFHSTVYSDDHQARLQGGLGGPITNATVVGSSGGVGGVATAGTFQLGASPGGLIDRTEAIFDNDTIQSFGWRNTWNFTEGWKAVTDVNHNTAKRHERDIEAYAGIATPDTLSFTLPQGATVPHFTVGNPGAYVDPNQIHIRDQTGWSGINGVPQAGYIKGPDVKDTLDAVRLDISHDLNGGMFTAVTGGLNYSDRSKARVNDEGLIVSTTGGGHDPIDFPAGSYVAHDIGGTGFDMLTFDPTSSLWPGATIQRKYTDDILSKTWTIDEKVATAYGKFDIDTQMGKTPIRGNVGLQLVHTEQSSGGYRADAGTGVTLTNPAATLSVATVSYNDVLPSLNLVADLGSGNLLRFGAGVEIARPTMTDERNSFALSYGQNVPVGTVPIFYGSSGNTALKPYKADAVDLSYEKYFGTKGYFSGALFYKKLQSYITQQTDINYDFQSAAANIGITTLPCTQDTSGATVCVPDWNGVYTTTVNGHGGNLKGIELSASVPFSLLTSWLDGLGLTGSYSNTTSSIRLPNVIGLNPNQQVPTSGAQIQLPGLSHINNKLMVYFEKWGFSAFVAQNYRSRYVGSVANTAVGGYPVLENIGAQKWISAQVGYEFQETFLKGLGIRLEGNNLNKPTYVQTDATGSVTTNKTGASVDLRVSYKF